jgi:sulfite reductase (ferredoxin)
LHNQLYSDSIYHSYAAIVNSAKALLLSAEQKTNSHATIINQFDEVFVATKKIELPDTFAAFIYQIKQNEPTEAFAKSYLKNAVWFQEQLKTYRKEELTNA